jgi:3-hydroxyacyl-[acyl-carrier-protein] dehydratase
MSVDTTPIIEMPDLLCWLPQAPPFRFVNRIREIDDAHIVAEYRFAGTEFFYAGHFPGFPVTPRVILCEAMAQGGVALQALYMLAKEFGLEMALKTRMLLTEVDMELLRPLIPPQTIAIRGELLLWRTRRIRRRITVLDERDELVATAKIAGMGVPLV